MYPLAEGMFAPRNQWYVAAWSSEVSRQPMERWILDEPIAFYRKEDGGVVALDGRCPHRSYPLGHGFVVGDNLECAYHGIKFRPDGSCAEIPSQAAVPKTCRVRSYPVAERWQWIWIWPGDPALADESKIPDHFEIGLSDPKNDCAGGYYRNVQGRYMLMHDNLFDLTHFGFLHRATFGAGTNMGEMKPQHSHGPGWVETRFDQQDIESPPFALALFGGIERVNRKFGLRFYLPCLHAGTDRVFKVGPDGADGEELGAIMIYHAVTPATRTSSHYFVAFGHSWESEIPDLSRMIVMQAEAGLDEDVLASARIETMIAHQAGRPSELLLRADEIAVRGRRLFEESIRAEQAEPPEAALKSAVAFTPRVA